MNAIYLSAAHKSSGKTIVSLGLSFAFRQQNLTVQTFKKGPDYIDPIWLSASSGSPCYNLDFYTMAAAEITNLYHQHSHQKDINIIEGNKGLFDGMQTTGGDANADLAKLLGVPVILVLDATGITRGVAPLISGYQNFDKDLEIAGVILNQVAGARHQKKLISAIEYYSDVPVLGAIARSEELIITQRHLGLMPANESSKSQEFIKTAAKKIAEQVDLEAILQVGKTAAEPSKQAKSATPNIISPPKNITIAVAKDSVFGFYYQDDIDAFAALGVDLVYFNTLKDNKLPAADGLFIGGGFPEMQLKSLSENHNLLIDIKAKIKAGLPTYAECGGLMYLSKRIENYPMVGVIDADCKINKKPIGRGYVQLAPSENHPWKNVSKHIFAHEFHYSKLENIAKNTNFAYRILRGVGVNGKSDGILLHNLLATYSHLRNVGGNFWVEQFVNFIKEIKGKKL
ncbi:MAG: cobyrinate a,c-diamide synthase [Candidatus Thioglobus sp.]|nr:cobyrinate a,c-diamide synthase [Candidatus Thioglobus sp.]